MGRYLHFVEPDPSAAAAARRRPGGARDYEEAVVAGADDVSYLWAAGEAGVARRILYLSPRPALDRRANAIGRPAPRQGEAMELGAAGFPRVAFERLPPVSERVLLDISASWFDEASGEELRAQLEASGIEADVVTANRLEGSLDVSAEARAGLDRFVAATRGEGTR